MTSAKSHKTPILGEIFEKLAPRIGARVVFEPEWKIAGQVIFANGKKKYFRYASIDLNPLGASEIAKDKQFSTYFMKSMGYSVILGETFFSDHWAKAIHSERNKEAAWLYAQQLGVPVIVKPNSGSQGRGVTLVENQTQFFRALNAIFEYDKVALVQKYIHGQDYRIVVLDDRIISAYQRIPLNVEGNGESSIHQLMQDKQAVFQKTGRDTVIHRKDPRMAEVLARQGFTFESVPATGKKVFLLDNANLSTGGDSIDVTALIHPDVAELCVNLTRDMGLRLCGVDLMLAGDITQSSQDYWIIEINASPGLDHYATSGEEQRKIVEDLYLEVLKGMEK